MADALYDNYKNVLLGGGVHGAVDLDADTLKVVLVDEGVDVPNLTTDQDFADRAAGSRIAISGALAGKTVGTVAAGVFDHDDVTFSAVSGASVESYDYYKDTGSESTSPLLCNIDAATGLPVTPNGGDITIQVAAGGAIDLA